MKLNQPMETPVPNPLQVEAGDSKTVMIRKRTPFVTFKASYKPLPSAAKRL